MNGKDLIIYILSNNLENEPVYKDGVFLGLMDVNTAAAKFNVGPAVINAWYELNFLEGIKIGDQVFIFPTTNLKIPGVTHA